MSGWKERWQQHQADVLQRDYLPGWYATRSRRRLLAGAGMFAVGLLWVDTALSWALPARDDALYADFILLAVMMVTYLPAVSLLNVATRGVTALAERQLDERQVGERLRAIALSHRIMLGILITLVVVGLAAGLAGGGPDSSVPSSTLVQLLSALFLTNFVLPLIISAWRLPDPPPEEE